jgi:hypothetical protein
MILILILILLILAHFAVAKCHQSGAEPEISHQVQRPEKSDRRRVPILPFELFAVDSAIQIYNSARKLSSASDSSPDTNRDG